MSESERTKVARQQLAARAQALKDRRQAVMDRHRAEAERKAKREERARHGARFLSESLAPVVGVMARIADGPMGMVRTNWHFHDGVVTFRVFIDADEGPTLVAFMIKADDERVWIEHDDSEIGVDVACGITIDTVEAVATLDEDTGDSLPF